LLRCGDELALAQRPGAAAEALIALFIAEQLTDLGHIRSPSWEAVANAAKDGFSATYWNHPLVLRNELIESPDFELFTAGKF
jgi:hypothetical protein